jgi:integrase
VGRAANHDEKTGNYRISLTEEWSLMPRAERIPSLRRHKPSDRAVVTIDGHDLYCGPWKSPEAKAEYDRIVSEWLANGRSLRRSGNSCSDMTVTELIARYWRFAREHYQHDGKPTAEIGKIRDALKPVERLYGETLAAEFGPVAFKTVRAEFVKADLWRTTIGYHLGKIRRFIKWAVENELLPGDAYHRLQAVAPLRAGRDGVREPRKITPVLDEHVDAILSYLPSPVRAMVELQRLTGMRPGEVVIMTMGQIDRNAELWVYRPLRHKTARIGRDREILLGARAQGVLKPWLRADPDAPLFSPIEFLEARNSERRKNRRTPMTPSSRARTRKKRPKRAPRLWYDKDAYGRAVRRACLRAGIPIWSPNRLRHSLATRVRQRFGLEAAQVILGHAKADVTQVYAESNRALAQQVMREIG